MCKLVRRENSPDSISLHLVQEYVIRWHRYKNCKWSLLVVPMVYKGLQSSFVSLSWPWSGRSLPQGELVGVLGHWTGGQCGWAPHFPATNYVTNPKSDKLTFLHMAGWLANCSWLAGWLAVKQMSTWPSPGRDIWWPSVLLLWSGWPVVKCTPHRQRHLVATWYYFTFGSGRLLVRCTPNGQRHLVAKCDITSGQVDLFIWGVSLVPATISIY